MKREFGAKLVEDILPRLDLTHVIDCSGAYIPGHGTPTVILYGRARAPIGNVIRTVRGIRGEPSAPEDAAKGLIWSAIVEQIDLEGSISEFISTEDTPRSVLAKHPWNIGGGGAADVQDQIEEGATATLEERIAVRSYTVWIGGRAVRRETLEIGFASFPGADDVFIGSGRVFERAGVPGRFVRKIVSGDQVRDYQIAPGDSAFVPYDDDRALVDLEALGFGARYLWTYRTTLDGIVSFGGKTRHDLGAAWWGWYRWVAERYRNPLTITFGEVATHNHFVLDRGGKIFKQTAPVIKLPASANEDDHLGLLGLLNSSTACFWLKQVCHNKGAAVDDRGARQRTDPFEDFYALNSTNIAHFPVAENLPIVLTRSLDAEACRLAVNLAGAVCARTTPNRAVLAEALVNTNAALGAMIALQEEIDWHCYGIYGLVKNVPQAVTPPSLQLGKRAFEIVMARRIAEDGLETT